jgi:integrase
MPDNQTAGQTDLSLSAQTPVPEVPKVPKVRSGGKRRGRHPANELTDLRVRNAKKPGRYPDGGGLYLIVDRSGAKRWLLRTVALGKRCDIGLGGLDLYSLRDARDKARELRRLAREGGDPLAARRLERGGALTFEQAARQIHGNRQDGWRNKKHRAQWLATLVTYAFPVIGSKRIDRIATPDVLMVLSPIWSSRPETARRVRQRIRAVLDWATAAGLRHGENPVEGVNKGLPVQQDRPQHHAAMLPTDVPGFVQDLHGATAKAAAKLASEFLVLTVCRTGEVLGAKWPEFDLENKLWTIPAERMKGKRPHRVPLPARALAILEEAKHLSDGTGYVFPGRRRGDPLSQMALLQLMRRMGRAEVPHGFRSTFRDWAAEKTPFPREVAEAALAHTVRNKVEAAYLRTDHLERRRDLMEAWAAWCVPAGGNVVNLPLFEKAAG